MHDLGDLRGLGGVAAKDLRQSLPDDNVMVWLQQE
jgi:hypothetical protein